MPAKAFTPLSLVTTIAVHFQDEHDRGRHERYQQY